MDGVHPAARVRDGRAWRIGDDGVVSWIQDGTSITKAITSAVPPVFDAYATLALPESWQEQQDRHDAAVIELLTRHAAWQPWWLGYLDSGAGDVVFADAPRATLYTGWEYVLVEAGPRQASTWRRERWWDLLEGGAAEPDVSGEPVVAGLHAVGRRVDLYRRARGAGRGFPARSRAGTTGQTGRARRLERHPTGTRSPMTARPLPVRRPGCYEQLATGSAAGRDEAEERATATSP